MDIPTVTVTQEEFDALPVSESGRYDQPKCRYLSSTGQWLLIDPKIKEGVAVLEIGTRPAFKRSAGSPFASPKGPRHTKPKRRK